MNIRDVLARHPHVPLRVPKQCEVFLYVI
jgi:hypothetical protein